MVMSPGIGLHGSLAGTEVSSGIQDFQRTDLYPTGFSWVSWRYILSCKSLFIFMMFCKNVIFRSQSKWDPEQCMGLSPSRGCGRTIRWIRCFWGIWLPWILDLFWICTQKLFACKSNAWAQYHNSGESDYNNIKYYKILITIFAHRFLSSYKTWQAWNQKFLLVKLTPSGVVSFSKTTRGEDTSTWTF